MHNQINYFMVFKKNKNNIQFETMKIWFIIVFIYFDKYDYKIKNLNKSKYIYKF